MLDLLVRGGTVVDGSGAPSRVADVGVRDGRVVSIGSVDESASRTVDATGLVVAPGFVDIHTHYDAQLFWDPTASPSPLHGVTTVFGGNCGFSIAPAGPEHRDYLMRMMARVEGMPLTALEKGLPWDWSSFGDWLGRLEGAIGVNAGFLCGHSALRRAVMGDDAVGSEASPKQLEDMAALLRAALADGAMGFSTSTASPHLDGEGQPVPSRFATDEELRTLAAQLHDYPGTTIELILAGCLNGFTESEIDLLVAMSCGANRPINWNVLGISVAGRAFCEQQLAASSAAAARGARVVALTLPPGSRIRLSFLTGAPLAGLPGWREVLTLPVPERMTALRDPAVRQRMAAGAASEEAGSLRGIANWPIMRVVETFSDETRAYEGRTIAEIAAERGQEPFDAMLDVVLADELRTGLQPPARPETDEDRALRLALWRDPRTVIGGSDAGAHLDAMCGAIYSTSLLQEVREHGHLPLEEAIQMLTDAPARLYGLKERGRLQEGWWADMVLFDPETVGYRAESTRADLPGGASRLYAESVGVHHVIVNGSSVVTDGTLTGGTPGRLLRSGRDTETVPVPGGNGTQKAP